MQRKRGARAPLLTYKDAAALKRIVQAGGLIVTRANGSVTYTLRGGSENVPARTVKRLIECRALIGGDRGLLDGFPQSSRARTTERPPCRDRGCEGMRSPSASNSSLTAPARVSDRKPHATAARRPPALPNDLDDDIPF